MKIYDHRSKMGKLKNNTVLNQLLIWVSIWLFYVFFFSYNSANFSYVLLFSTGLVPITIITSYVFIQILIPKFLATKKYLHFGIYSVLILLFTIFCVLLLIIVGLAYIPGLKYEDLPPMNKNYLFIVTLVYLLVFLVSYSSLWRNNTKAILENNELQKRLLKAELLVKKQELSYLKSQIHPHFLFNSLNAIYGLALKKSTETPDVILKLSSLLDYVLYNTSKKEVLLADEINHIENYMELEKIRFRDTLKVFLSKQLENKDIFVAPMLLLPFVENAFKHGSIIDGFLSVKIHIKVIDNELNFNIKNTYKPGPRSKGIGLENIKERLSILYPENFTLQIATNPDWFEITLKLSLLKQNKDV